MIRQKDEEFPSDCIRESHKKVSGCVIWGLCWSIREVILFMNCVTSSGSSHSYKKITEYEKFPSP